MVAEELGNLLQGKQPDYVLNADTLQTFSWTDKRKIEEEVLEMLTEGPGPGVSDLELKPKKAELKQSNPVKSGKSPLGEDVLFIKILKSFLKKVANDEFALNFAQKKKLGVQYIIQDMDLSLYMIFREGRVLTGLGEAPEKTDVILKMNAEIFDAMFTGRINANKAAMKGDISFSGDTMKAMSMRRLKLDPLYQQARQEMGDPGDLSQIHVSQVAVTTAAEDNSPNSMMLNILQQFTELIAVDPKVTDFARGKNVTFLFIIKDMNQKFYMSFIEGSVKAALGDSPQEPEVRLKMSAETLDKMFTGTINATKAAMSGQLSFSGDTGKAMSFQRIQKNMMHLYQAAREKVGDPGDLSITEVSEKSEIREQASPVLTPVGQETRQIPALTKMGDVRDEILKILNELYLKGLITATGGNISARLENNPDEIWIMPSPIFKGDLRPEMMVRIDLFGNLLDEDSFSASSERKVHCAVYQRRPEVQAVIHTHAPQAILMALTGSKFLPISTEAAFLGDIPVVPFIMPGTNELGERVGKLLVKEAWLFLCKITAWWWPDQVSGGRRI